MLRIGTLDLDIARQSPDRMLQAQTAVRRAIQASISAPSTHWCFSGVSVKQRKPRSSADLPRFDFAALSAARGAMHSLRCARLWATRTVCLSTDVVVELALVA